MMWNCHKCNVKYMIMILSEMPPPIGDCASTDASILKYATEPSCSLVKSLYSFRRPQCRARPVDSGNSAKCIRHK